MSSNYSGCELVELGIQIEKNGRDFYLALADFADNEEIKSVFKDLAEEEEKHIGVFKKIFDDSCKYEPRGAYPDEYFAYMNALASQYIFTQEGKGKELARNVKDCEEGIDLGIRIEKDSILLYQEMKELVPDKDKSLIDDLILQEKKHLSRLVDLKKGCGI